MKRHIIAFLLLLLILTFTACENAITPDRANTISDTTRTAVPPSGYQTMANTAIPVHFQTLEDLINARREVNPEQDLHEHGLLRLECYQPVYTGKLLELTGIGVDYIGGKYGYQGTTEFEYTIVGAGSGQIELEFSRADDLDAEALLQDWVKRAKLNPLEGADGVYYSGVSNPWDNGELSFTEFAWVYDGYRFRMEVFPGALESILAYDPDALKGSLFELVKIDMDTGEPIAAPPPADDSSVVTPTPAPPADTVPSMQGVAPIKPSDLVLNNCIVTPNPSTPPDTLPTSTTP